MTTTTATPQAAGRFQPGQHIHLVGIGGFGISAIARILLEKGHRISGSDKQSSALTQALARDGATVHEGHDAAYITGADMLIISSAVGDDHIEVQAARARGIPVYKRDEVIAELMAGKTVIAVAGTHGKTTTTAMIVHILREAGLDPSYIVGGVMVNTGTNAGLGAGAYFVIEADEYDHMFLGLRPNIAVITSVEYDHPDFFESEQAVLKAFLRFMLLLPESDSFLESTLVACVDDPHVAELLHKARATRRLNTFNDITYGINTTTEVMCRAQNISSAADASTSFDFWMRGLKIGRLRLPLLGQHNVKNAMAALIVAEMAGVMFEEAALALASFKSTGRRFEIRAAVAGVLVVDDYAHHPTAIKATLEGARAAYPQHQLWAVWQPHTYSRTQALLAQYTTAFASAHTLLVTEIYAAREQATPQSITAAQVVSALLHPDAYHTPTHEDVLAFLETWVKAPAVVVVMSAGDGPKISQAYVEWMQNAHSSP